jgi:hypothetical protein
MAMHGAHILMVVAFAGSLSAAAAGPAAVGTWEGEAICTVPDSPCHDEHVQYRVTADKDNAAQLTIAADKIVNGSPVFMGALICDYQPTQSTLTVRATPPSRTYGSSIFRETP